VPRGVEAANASSSPACRAEHGERAAAHDAAATAATAATAARTQSPTRQVPAPEQPFARPRAFMPLSQRPATHSAEHDPRAITEAHRRRLDGGRLLATAPRLDWAALLERTYEVDVFRCPRCHGAARVVAAITEPAVIRKILDHVREPPARAPPSGARRLGEDGVDAADVWLDPEVDVGA